MEVADLKKEYDKLQLKYGAKELDSIYNGGCEKNPDICFVFMNPTGRNIASLKSWQGRKSPWLGTKNIWKLFHEVNLLSDEVYNAIIDKKPKDWNYDFCDYVYQEIENNRVFITNLGKCTQVDARPLSDEVLSKYLDLLLKEIEIIDPKVIITFGNQVSSIILDEKISVSQVRKKCFEKKIGDCKYKIFPVYYPVGNGIFNMDKSIEDIRYILYNELERGKKMNQEVRFYKDKNTKSAFILTNGKIEDNDSIIEIKANTVDAAVEKHIPVYDVNHDKIQVSVGSIEHPMSEEHSIMWIAQVYDNKVNMVRLSPNDKPVATFDYVKGSVIYAYCNLHGLWKSTVE